MAVPEEGDDELYIKLCRLRELFSGRFTTDEAAILLNHADNHLDRAVTFIFGNEPSTIREILEQERAQWTEVNHQKLRQTRQRPGLLARARSGQIDTSYRQFACKDCDKVWWKRTPERKQVSRCNKCRRRYDAIPRHKEWGWAEFNCTNCARQFGGWCAMYMRSPCYGCKSLTAPTRIVPTQERDAGQGGIKQFRHSCAAPDCPGRDYYPGPLPPNSELGDLKCVHPGSLRSRGLPLVVNPSNQHDSTGSTVDTFLSQTDLYRTPAVFFQSLPTLEELGSDDD